jgi:hypothetical protein
MRHRGISISWTCPKYGNWLGLERNILRNIETRFPIDEIPSKQSWRQIGATLGERFNLRRGTMETLGSSEKTPKIERMPMSMLIFVWLWAVVILYFALHGALN